MSVPYGVDLKSKVWNIDRLARLEAEYKKLLPKLRNSKPFICEICDEEFYQLHGNCCGIIPKDKRRLAKEMRARLVYYKAHVE